MEGQMVTVPAVKGRGNVDRSVHKCRVQGERERKESQWNISERKGECQRVESSAAQSRKRQGRKKQAIVVNHWQDQTQHCETDSCNQKHAAGRQGQDASSEASENGGGGFPLGFFGRLS